MVREPDDALRVSDAERDEVLGALADHVAAGRLTLDELEDRSGRVLVAKTRGDLAAITRDLPGDRLDPALGLYEVAYLCGGPRRVALTAVVTMRQDGRIKISPARHRIQVTRDEANHPVERAVLDAVAWPGMRLRLVLDEVAGSAAVRSAGDELRRRVLLGKHSHLTSPGRKLRDELREKVPDGLRTAVLGTSGVDSELQKVLDAPDPPPGSTLIPKRRDKREHAHDEAPPGTDVAGYPGVPGRW
jgi:hypothetical protein